MKGMVGYVLNANFRNPDPVAFCDQCDFVYFHKDLKKQMQWAGDSLVWTGFLVCSKCLDVPNVGFRPSHFPPDPSPVINARPGANPGPGPGTNPSPPFDVLTEELRNITFKVENP